MGLGRHPAGETSGLTISGVDAIGPLARAGGRGSFGTLDWRSFEQIMKKEDRLLQQVRERCLSLPETSEVGSWGHPNFRAGKRTFVTLEWISGRPSIAFRLSPTDVDLLLRRNGFFLTPYGQGGWVSLWADGSLDWRLVERLLEKSYRMVALKRMIAALDGTKGRS
jgi:predicted DNA-binding protein (MmcQ/YjbR family)